MTVETSTSFVVNSTVPFIEYIDRKIKFWLYFVFLIPSILFSLFLLHQFLFDRTLRRTLSNHIIILLLLTIVFCQMTMYPWMMYHYNHRGIWYRSLTFCVIWGFIDWAIYMLQILLFAWAAVERHILIFHDKLVSTRRKRFLFHYLPPVLIIIYCLFFYSFVYFYPSCSNIFDVYLTICVVVCLSTNPMFRAIETFFNNVLPNFVIIVFSILLLFRIFWQKQRINQPMRWRKHRKMTIQLLSISVLYLSVTSPWALVVFLRMCGWMTDLSAALDYYAFYVSYYVVLLYPFFAMLSLPDLKMRLKKLFFLSKCQRTVEPIERRTHMAPSNWFRMKLIRFLFVIVKRRSEE